MAVKELFRDLRPLPLYAMLGLTLVFFTLELVVSHVTHALTLLVDSYHTLCNLIALTGCLISIKYGSQREHAALERRNSGEEELVSKPKELHTSCTDGQTCSEQDHKHQRRKQQAPGSSERRLRNTFGWARVEVLVMLIGAVFLASLCFSLVVEAVQTLFHIGHIDEMHNPYIVMIVGALGLLLNGLCYILIGGYTFHQGSLLHVTPSGDVVLEGALSHDEVRRGGRRLSARRVAAAAAAATSAVQVAPAAQVCDVKNPPSPSAHLHSTLVRQGPREMLRDIIGLVFVIACAAVVIWTEQETDVAKYVDPVFSIVSALLLLLLSLPYMKESGRILLQTIPDYIDIESLKNELVAAFPSLVNVHEVHIWCLTPARVYATAHLVLHSHQDYVRIKEDLDSFFVRRGVTHATIQPEFCTEACPSVEAVEAEDAKCYLPCSTGECRQQACCGARKSSTASDDDDDRNVSCFGSSSHGHSHHGHSHGHGHSHHAKSSRRSAEKQVVPAPAKPPRQQQNETESRKTESSEQKTESSEQKTESSEHKTESERPGSQRAAESKRVRHQRSFSAGSDPTLSSSGELGISQVRQHSLEEIPLP